MRNLSRLSPPSVSSERERCRACEEKADTRPCFRICPPDNYIIGAPGHEGRERSVSRQFGQTPLIGRPGRMPSCTFRTIFLGKFLDKHRKRLERASINYRAAKEICPENFITLGIVVSIISIFFNTHHRPKKCKIPSEFSLTKTFPDEERGGSGQNVHLDATAPSPTMRYTGKPLQYHTITIPYHTMCYTVQPLPYQTILCDTTV